MRFPLSLTHQTPLVNAIKFDDSVADIVKRWKLHLFFFAYHHDVWLISVPAGGVRGAARVTNGFCAKAEWNVGQLHNVGHEGVIKEP